MELKLVYRSLRKISDWTISGYYSEVYVEGEENVPKDGPLVVAATHHNEILDIATLCITIPYGRHVSFWAKSTMFKNPVMGAILSSSGAIPVKRNPNSGTAATSLSSSTSSLSSGSSSGVASIPTTLEDGRASLFHHTSLALWRGETVGVFPEGTSYTQSSIVQVMPGAGWVGVEYLKWVRGKSTLRQNGSGKGKEKKERHGLKIVPVAMVYTDKARYMSRVYVRYGSPIEVDSYAAELFSGDEEDIYKKDALSKAVVKKIMVQVEQQLRDMTINAEDWDTICATSMARNILWRDEDGIELKDWVEISQRLVHILTPTSEMSPSDRKVTIHLKNSLATYYALLHYTGIRHSILCSLLPLSPSPSSKSNGPHLAENTSDSIQNSPSSKLLLRPTISLLSSLPFSLVRLALSSLSLIFHLPAYFTGFLAGYLAPKDEDEAVAQFQGVGGCLGIGVAAISALSALGWKRVTAISRLLVERALVGIGTAGGVHLGRVQWNGAKTALAVFGSVYAGLWILVKWHGLFVDGNLQQLQRLLTYHKLVSALLFSSRSQVTTSSLEEYKRYFRPPLPAENVFIRKTKKAQAAAAYQTSETSNSARESLPVEDDERKNPPPPSAETRRMLVGRLITQRAEVCQELFRVLKDRKDGGDLVGFLERKGARVMG